MHLRRLHAQLTNSQENGPSSIGQLTDQIMYFFANYWPYCLNLLKQESAKAVKSAADKSSSSDLTVLKNLLTQLDEETCASISSKEVKLYVRAHIAMTMLFMQKFEVSRDRKVRIKVKKLLRDLQLELDICEMLEQDSIIASQMIKNKSKNKNPFT